ncbi:RNA-directed DNA polymerase, eukaryota, reverse transcriptase zinc-binding domain protein [Tanacetum coccineum]
MGSSVRGGYKLSNESVLERLPCNIFITNFPVHLSAKELWNICAQYGTVQDLTSRRSFPNRVNLLLLLISVREHDRRVLQDYLLEKDSRLNKGEGLPNDLPNCAKTFHNIGVIDRKISVDMTQKAKRHLEPFLNRFSALDWSRVPVEVGEDVSNVVKEFFNSSIFSNGYNLSFIALIPKVLNAKHLSDFRPISLIGCQYKIICKILANRLNLVIDELISHENSAFIKGGQILDGPLILNEIVSWCKSRKKQALLFKVDFQKAFDSVRWDHLDDILGKFGFGSKWRGWIRGCLHSSKASVFVNGSLTEEFLFHRDIQSMANSFGCLANNLPFTYLGVKVFANMTRINSWNELIQKVTIKLSKWKAKSLSVGGKRRLLDDDGNPLVSTGIMKSDSEVEVVFNETANLRISTSGKDGSDKGYGTNSLLEQWRDSYPDNDDYDPYDDDMYENHDVSEHLQSICDDLDITVRVESRNHLFFGCSVALDLFQLLGRWWNIDIINLIDPFSWESWFNGLRLDNLRKLALEASFFSMWWHIWK